MNRELVRRRLSREGPNISRTADGQEYLVPHPEFVLVGRYSVVFEDPDGTIEVINPGHIVAIRNASRFRGKDRGSRHAA